MLPPWCEKLYPEQEQVIDYLVSSFQSGTRVGLLDAPTGFGKTLTGEMIRQGLNCKGLYICTSLPLQSQFCVSPDTKILRGDLRWIPAIDMVVGDRVLAFDEYHVGARRHWREGRVLQAKQLTLPCYRLDLSNGESVISSSEHRWLTGTGSATRWETTENIRPGERNGANLIKLLEVWDIDNSWIGGYLAAAFDGEGHLRQGPPARGNGWDVNLMFAQNENPMLEMVKECLQLRGIQFSFHKSKDCVRLGISRRRDQIQFLGEFRPPRLLPKLELDHLGMINPAERIKVVGKTFLGDMPVIGLETSTKTYIADGYASHNSADFPDAAILKGRRNYPTLDFPEDFDHPHDPVTAADCDKEQQECSFCSVVYDCPYERAKTAALGSPLACTNTAYFLTEANGPARFSNKFPLIIVDEADKLESQLLSVIEVNLSGKLVSRLRLKEPRYKTKSESWAEWCLAVSPKVSKFAETFDINNPKEAKQRVRYKRLAKRLEVVAAEIDEGGWTYDQWSNGTINFKPIRVSKWANDLLWRHGERFLLMSGTLIPAEIRESLAVPDPSVAYEAPSSFPVASRPIRVVGAAAMSKRVMDDSLPKITLAIKRILDRHPSERILIHTVSYALTQYLYNNLDRSRLIVYASPSERDHALHRYKQQSNSVLLAPSMDRGIDLPDDMCRVIVVAKIPYPDLGDKQINARLYEPGNRHNGQVWYAVNTIRDLIQMLGRGMRHENDACTHYILDSNFYKLNKEWGYLIPKWIKDAFVWGGDWKDELMVGID